MAIPVLAPSLSWRQDCPFPHSEGLNGFLKCLGTSSGLPAGLARITYYSGSTISSTMAEARKEQMSQVLFPTTSRWLTRPDLAHYIALNSFRRGFFSLPFSLFWDRDCFLPSPRVDTLHLWPFWVWFSTVPSFLWIILTLCLLTFVFSCCENPRSERIQTHVYIHPLYPLPLLSHSFVPLWNLWRPQDFHTNMTGRNICFITQ